MNRPRPLLSALAWAGFALIVFLPAIDSIPFHPDESSLLFQSRDLELVFSEPLSLAYDASAQPTRARTYRALNAPLPKYVLGLGRRLAGYGPESVAVDWDWSRGWQSNLASEALPARPLLRAARLASATLAALAVVPLFLAGRRGRSGRTGVFAAVLYLTNALVLLHGRRAMAEGTLLLTISVALLAVLMAWQRPLLAGVTVALAISSKHSALPLAGAGLLLCAALPVASTVRWRRRIRQLALFALALILITILLNPLLWLNPIEGTAHIVRSRQSFVEEQTSLTLAIAPDRLLDTPSKRAASLLGHLFFGPLQFSEVGNYDPWLSPAIKNYLRSPAHRLLRGPVGGGISLALTLSGFAFELRRWPAASRERRQLVASLLVVTTLLTGALVLFNPLPFQRYYLPLVPPLVLWQALGVSSVVEGIDLALSGGGSGQLD